MRLVDVAQHTLFVANLTCVPHSKCSYTKKEQVMLHTSGLSCNCWVLVLYLIPEKFIQLCFKMQKTDYIRQRFASARSVSTDKSSSSTGKKRGFMKEQARVSPLRSLDSHTPSVPQRQGHSLLPSLKSQTPKLPPPRPTPTSPVRNVASGETHLCIRSCFGRRRTPLPVTRIKIHFTPPIPTASSQPVTKQSSEQKVSWVRSRQVSVDTGKDNVCSALLKGRGHRGLCPAWQTALRSCLRVWLRNGVSLAQHVLR